MKDARYLIRIAHSAFHKPSDQAALLAKARVLAGTIKGKTINLRVSPKAIEFDLFCTAESDLARLKAPFNALGEVITCKRLDVAPPRSEEHTSELQSPDHLVCRLLLEKKKKQKQSLHDGIPT